MPKGRPGLDPGSLIPDKPGLAQYARDRLRIAIDPAHNGHVLLEPERESIDALADVCAAHAVYVGGSSHVLRTLARAIVYGMIAQRIKLTPNI